MAKKLLGDRKVGELDYKLGQVITDEEATAAGFDASDVSETDAAPTPKEGEEVVATKDTDADMDSASGGDADAEKAIAEEKAKAEAATLAAKIGKGEIPDGMVAIPLTEEMYAADQAIYDEHGVKVGDTVYVTPTE